jgi:DNA invertase Pin-like site-specific DNA recombinase
MAGRYLIYVRQSYRRHDDAEVSEEQQEEAARRLLPKGATAEVIRDTGGHRSGRTDNRDGYRVLIGRLSDPGIAGVAVYDISRLARNARLMLNLKHELDARNLHLIVSNLPDSRFDTAVGRFLFGQLCLAAQFQADLDSERMVGITRTKFEQGGHNGSDPYGYRTARTPEGKVAQPHRLEVVPDEADVVRLIFDEYGAERWPSQGALAADLNARGVDKRGRPWREKSVCDVIRRGAFYCGYVTYRRSHEQRPGSHEPIITPEQRHLAERAARRRHRPGQVVAQHRAYPLRGLVICGHCERRMRGETHARASRRDYRYYRCPGRRTGECPAPNVNAVQAERYVIEKLARLRHVPSEATSIRRGRLEATLKRLTDAFVWGHLEEADYRAQRREIEGKLSELPPPADSNLIAFDQAAERLLPIGTILRETTPEHQGALIRHIVESVTLADGTDPSITLRPEARPFYSAAVAPPERFELPTQALGRPRSIH